MYPSSPQEVPQEFLIWMMMMITDQYGQGCIDDFNEKDVPARSLPQMGQFRIQQGWRRGWPPGDRRPLDFIIITIDTNGDSPYPGSEFAKKNQYRYINLSIDDQLTIILINQYHVAVVVAAIKDTATVGAPVRSSHGGGEGAWPMFDIIIIVNY